MPPRLSSPPRRVPLSLRTLSIFNAGTQLGLCIAGFSAVFFWSFVPNADLSFFNFHGLSQAQGYVTRVEATNARQGRMPVRANHYTYSVAGRRFDGTSYSSGDDVEPGKTVTVEYKTSDPSQSRIAGERRNLFGLGVLLVLIFPAIGLLVTGAALALGSKQMRLLRNGEAAVGTVIERQNLRSAKGAGERVTYAYTTRDGVKRQRTRNVSDELKSPQTERLLIYDPQHPDDADVLDRDSVDALGGLQPRPVAALLSLIVPVLFVVGNIIAARIIFGR